MVGWIVLGVVLLALAIGVAAVRPVLVRLPRLRRAAQALEQQRDRAETLQRSARQLAERAAVLQRQAESVREGFHAIRPKRSN